MAHSDNTDPFRVRHAACLDGNGWHVTNPACPGYTNAERLISSAKNVRDYKRAASKARRRNPARVPSAYGYRALLG